MNREKKDKTPDTFRFLNNGPGFGGKTDRITDDYLASSSIMVCPICLVGLVFDCIMIH